MTRTKATERIGRLWQTMRGWALPGFVILVVVIVLVVLALTGVIDAGFGEYTPPTPDTQRGKTVWDILDLIIVPLILGIAAIAFTRLVDRRERDVESDRTRESALQTYLDRTSELLLQHGLRESQHDAGVRTVARARTLAVLRVLDGRRKGALLRFLSDAKLAEALKPILSLKDADLTSTYLRHAHLPTVDLSEADLTEADLSDADLRHAYMRGTTLRQADLRSAHLGGANLQVASLERARLSGATFEYNGHYADLSGAHASGADLRGARLQTANLTEIDLRKADLRAANLSGSYRRSTHLSGANLTRADLRGARLEDADLGGSIPTHPYVQDRVRRFGAILREADLRNCNLKRANLEACDLCGADLRGAALGGANLRNAIYNQATQWPHGFTPPSTATKLEGGALPSPWYPSKSG